MAYLSQKPVQRDKAGALWYWMETPGKLRVSEK